MLCRGRGREGDEGAGGASGNVQPYLVEIIVEATARVDHLDGRGGVAGIVKTIVYAVAALHRDPQKRCDRKRAKALSSKRPDVTFWSSVCGGVGGGIGPGGGSWGARGASWCDRHRLYPSRTQDPSPTRVVQCPEKSASQLSLL